MASGPSAARARGSSGTAGYSLRCQGSNMWMMALAMNTSTADTRIGSQRSDNAINPPFCLWGSLAECLDPRDGAPQDQGVDVVRALVGVHHLEVHHVADDAELIRDAVAAEHVARRAGDVERLAARVPLHDRGDLHRRAALVLHAPEAQAALQAERNLGLHVGELLL